MNKILKYELQITDDQIIHCPVGAKFLTAQFQYEKLQIWAEVDDNPVHQDRKIVIVGTGHDFVSRGLEYITSVQQYEGKLVWHIYEDIRGKLN